MQLHARLTGSEGVPLPSRSALAQELSAELSFLSLQRFSTQLRAAIAALQPAGQGNAAGFGLAPTALQHPPLATSAPLWAPEGSATSPAAPP